jgi:HSP20 family protein
MAQKAKIGVTIDKAMSKRDGEEFFWQNGADFSKISEELRSLRPKLANQKQWEPRIDLVEEEQRVVLKAEIAGVNGDDIDICFVPESHSIILKGNRPEDRESEQSRVGVFQLEILYGEFERRVELPQIPLESDQIKAIYKNGLLIVLIPKRNPASKQVVIQTE